MNIWMVSREYAGIAEAGGVKNVVCSLSEALVRTGNSVTCFLPFYGCVNSQVLSVFKQYEYETTVFSAGANYSVSYSSGFLNGVRIVLVGAECFYEKQNVYTYNAEDKAHFPECRIGEGYSDQHLMNSIFEKAIFAYGDEIFTQKDAPDIVHCHDACTAALPAITEFFKRNSFENTKFVVTIHNAGPCYHHEFKNIEEAAFYTNLPNSILAGALNGNRVEPYLLASATATLTTVSPDYAAELCDPATANTDGLAPIFAERRIKIFGITNGIDICRYTPEDTGISRLPYAFSPEEGLLDGKYMCRSYFIENVGGKDSPELSVLPRSGFLDENGRVYFCYHGRLVRQKGIYVLLEAAQEVLDKIPEARIIINGQGEEELRDMCSAFARKNPGRVCFFYGYEKSFSRLFTAVADFALLPSEFEPCGTEDYIAQIYGTVPVAHATGGLNKILDKKTGFLYKPNSAAVLSGLMIQLSKKKLEDARAFDVIVRNAARCLRENYTWEIVAKNKYQKLYENSLQGY